MASNISIMTPQQILAAINNRVENVTSRLDLSQCESTARAAGGYGRVYRGQFLPVDGVTTIVALKCVDLLIEDNPAGHKDVESFANEVYAWFQCHHENILELLGIAEFLGQLVMVSPWVIGRDISRLLPTANWTTRQRYKICTQIVRAVAYLHELNIVHADLKALNVLMTEGGTPKLIDFGCSIIREHSLQFRSSTRGITINWTAPEILDDKAKAHPTFATDVYTLGMTIYEIMTGRIPYQGVSLQVLIENIINATPPERFQEGFPDDDPFNLWTLLTNRCWVREPKGRISAAELRDEMNKHFPEN